MELPSYFSDFLSNIRLRTDQVKELRSAHATIRQRIKEDDDLSELLIETFLQGSYRRATAIRPMREGKADVDVIVVTNLDHRCEHPQDALERFSPLLKKFYPGKWRMQGRSINIELSAVNLDLVVTAAPSEAQNERYAAASVLTDAPLEDLKDWRLVKSWIDVNARDQPGMYNRLALAEREDEWKMEPLLIPDRDAHSWQQTNPIEQIRWTWAKNKRCNLHYVNVVKSLKWWRHLNPTPKYPKGYPLEHLIGTTCPDGIASVAEGVTLTLETIVSQYHGCANSGVTPYLKDHGVNQDVFRRVSGEEFAAFYALAEGAAVVAREALNADTTNESADSWRHLFGSRFPEGSDRGGRGGAGTEGGSGGEGGFTPRSGPTVLSGGRFA